MKRLLFILLTFLAVSVAVGDDTKTASATAPPNDCTTLIDVQLGEPAVRVEIEKDCIAVVPANPCEVLEEGLPGDDKAPAETATLIDRCDRTRATLKALNDFKPDGLRTPRTYHEVNAWNSAMEHKAANEVA